MFPTQTARTHIGPYALHERIGLGGMGEVYRATSPTGVTVAVKILRPEVASQPEVRRRFTREARAAAALEHEHIVQLLDFGSTAGEFFIVMELVDGGSLAAWRSAPPDGETLVQVVDQILAALAYAHSCGVVHRDLKPENVLLSFGADGTPCAKVMDFGVVFFRDERDLDISGRQTLVGTPAYMSPEQALNLCDVSPATDLYAVGVLLFELLTGARPYSGTSAAGTVVAHVNQPIPVATPRPGYSVDGDLGGVLHRLLAKDPADRYLFAADARDALRRVRISGTAAPDPRKRPKLTGRAAAFSDDHSAVTLIKALEAEQPQATEATTAYRLFGLREPPFTGRREAVRAARASAIETVAGGRPGVTFVYGDLGMGKSRLLRQLRQSVEERGLMQAWSGAFDGRPEGPEVGLRQAIRRGLGVSTLTAAESRSRIGAVIDRERADDTWEIEALCELVVPDLGQSEPRLRGDAATRWALMRRAIARGCARRPVLLLLDDVHLGGEDALRWIAWALRGRDGAVPWHAVVTLRPEVVRADRGLRDALDEAAAAAGDRATVIELGPLDPGDIRRVVRGCVPMDARVGDVIAMRASGNPMLAVELVRHLVDSGRLEGFGAAPSADELLDDIPLAVSALLQRRLAEVASAHDAPSELGALLEQLAFLGLRFSEDLAEAAARELLAGDASAALGATLHVAALHGVLTEDESGALRFESGLLRDVLVEQAGDRAPARHRIAARAKAAVATIRTAERAMEIGRHYDLAGDEGAALAHYREAAARATLVGRLDTAATAWRAIEPLPHTPAVAVEAALGLAAAALHSARYDAAAQQAGRATALAADARLPAPAEATRLLAEIARQRGDIREARRLFAAALAAFDAGGDMHGVAAARGGLGRLELRDGRLAAAREQLSTARDLFAMLGDGRLHAEALRELAQASLLAGQLDDAFSQARQAHAELEAISDRHGAALCLSTLGDVARARASFTEAGSLYAKARADLVATGDWHAATIALMNAGSAAHEDSRAAAARAAFVEAFEALGAMGDQHGATVAAAQIALVDAQQGRWNLAEPRIAFVLERDSIERVDEGRLVAALVELSRVSLLDGRPTLARRLLELAAHKLGRTAAGTPLSARIEQVHYLLGEIAADPDTTAVVDLLGDD
ncbi:MAG: protein kinase [Myxococcales bacterium]|nr:protein kinase [Myxococcales bacterium]MCB9533942.1 protein kinase [Myxococcales bacterium]